MKAFLCHCSNRFGYDGWALRMRGDDGAIPWTVSTTRSECRALRRDRDDLFERGAEIVKVKISVEVVE